MHPEIIGEQVIKEAGCFRRVRRWFKGCHPEIGQIVWGLTGLETMVEIDCIRPMKTLEVK